MFYSKQSKRIILEKSRKKREKLLEKNFSLSKKPEFWNDVLTKGTKDDKFEIIEILSNQSSVFRNYKMIFEDDELLILFIELRKYDLMIIENSFESDEENCNEELKKEYDSIVLQITSKLSKYHLSGEDVIEGIIAEVPLDIF